MLLKDAFLCARFVLFVLLALGLGGFGGFEHRFLVEGSESAGTLDASNLHD